VALALLSPQCLMKLDKSTEALRTLVAIGSKHRTLGMNLLMGSLHKAAGQKKEALASYKAALKHSPLALDAIVALAELGR
jgi:predicted negative regulator of RcsB-dependent stress response